MKHILLFISISSILFGYQTSIEERLYKLNRELMCPVCEGLTLEQSQSKIAIEMREEIKKMVIKGMTDKEIKDYYVEKYGVIILANPPADGFNLLMWIIPIIFGLFGITILYKYFFN
ncbi:MAG: cytochrome c-type biogenesis protein [Candidatus Neomarinimicrobiota bacterium]|nr:cytochrome c-type biogenesis protein [Candidatus Neomarinimicrobiota bacterium]